MPPEKSFFRKYINIPAGSLLLPGAQKPAGFSNRSAAGSLLHKLAISHLWWKPNKNKKQHQNHRTRCKTVGWSGIFPALHRSLSIQPLGHGCLHCRTQYGPLNGRQTQHASSRHSSLFPTAPLGFLACCFPKQHVCNGSWKRKRWPKVRRAKHKEKHPLTPGTACFKPLHTENKILR